MVFWQEFLDTGMPLRADEQAGSEIITSCGPERFAPGSQTVECSLERGGYSNGLVSPMLVWLMAVR